MVVWPNQNMVITSYDAAAPPKFLLTTDAGASFSEYPRGSNGSARIPTTSGEKLREMGMVGADTLAVGTDKGSISIYRLSPRLIYDSFNGRYVKVRNAKLVI